MLSEISPRQTNSMISFIQEIKINEHTRNKLREQTAGCQMGGELGEWAKRGGTKKHELPCVTDVKDGPGNHGRVQAGAAQPWPLALASPLPPSPLTPCSSLLTPETCGFSDLPFTCPLQGGCHVSHRHLLPPSLSPDGRALGSWSPAVTTASEVGLLFLVPCPPTSAYTQLLESSQHPGHSWSLPH